VSIKAPDADSGWSGLFWQAFTRSRNAMLLVDDQRRHVEINGAYLALVGYSRAELIGRPVYELFAHGPMATPTQWEQTLRHRQFTGRAEVVCAGGQHVTVEFAGHPEVVTGRRLVLFVALRTARAGRSLPEAPPSATEAAPSASETRALSTRELDVIRLLAAGLTGPEVAAELQLAHNTVRTHVRNAMAKSGTRSRAQLVAKSLAEGAVWRAGG
jgi:PAS domain S-box-containing protein